MQKPIDDVVSEVKRVLNTPPSRPIRLIFLENEILYEMVQNQVKELFSPQEIVNMSNFIETDEWKERELELEEVEKKYGQGHKKYRQILCDILEKRINSIIENNGIEKLLIIQDEILFTLGLDPIHFLLAYMAENKYIVNNSIPIIWLTIGSKEEYSINEYCYYKTETTPGRMVKIEQSTLSSCIKDYRLPE